MKRRGYLLVVGFVGFGCFSAEDVPTPSFDSPGFNDVGGMSSSSSGMGGMGGGGGAAGGGGMGGSSTSSSGSTSVECMCDPAKNSQNSTACTSDCKCGIDGNMMLPPDVVDKATAFTVTGTESCYVWVETPKSWHEALSLCNQMGMHLAYFDSTMPQVALAAVKPKLVDKMFNMAKPTWVGALRQYPEQENKDDFFWLNGTEVIKGQALWASSQPDNFMHGMADEDEDCAEIPSWADRLNDDTCTDEKSFLCESP